MSQIKDDKIIVENQKTIEELRSSEYGEIKNSKLELSLIEALYLLNEDKLSLKKSKKELLNFATEKEKNFELKFLVYKDLRERGLFLKDGGKTSGFYLYGRGDKPSEDSFSDLVFVITERETLEISNILNLTQTAKQLRKNPTIALVDGEGDITYYRLKEFTPSGKVNNEFEEKIEAKISDDRIITWKGSEHFYLNYFFGKPFLEESYQLNFPEAYYLSKNEAIDLDPSVIRERGRQLDPEFDLKARVYNDLREKGLVPKTGFKFGTHFRVYTRYKGPEKLSHAEYLVQSLTPDTKLSPATISGAVRLAQNVRKKMLFAIANNEINYLKIRRVKI
ncbi:tRNA-intron lyase [archaeon SCG-AAA382B04]|nr:tRNA-intron lyase [archaeon SCG-AAA382B04]